MKNDGSVTTWGFEYGGDSSAAASELKSGVIDIFSSPGAFAALRADGSVITWGGAQYGGDSSAVAAKLSNGVIRVYSTDNAFAALKEDGSVVSWGEASGGGDYSSIADRLSTGVVSVTSTGTAFAALKADGSVVTWGGIGGDSTAVSEDLKAGVTKVYASRGAFAALKDDGSVVTWGQFAANRFEQAQSPITDILSTDIGFVGLKADGSVITWDEGSYSTTDSSITGGVSRIFTSSRGYVGLRLDGTIYNPDYMVGGYALDKIASLTDVVDIRSSAYGYAALCADGSVYSWYVGGFGDNDPATNFFPQHELTSGVARIFSSDYSFAALRQDGSIVSWGVRITGENGGVSEVFSQVFNENVATVADPFSDERVSYSDSGSAAPASITIVPPQTLFKEGVILSAPNVSGDPDGDVPGPRLYQWYINDVAVNGATASTYATQATDTGMVRVEITYEDALSFTSTISSKPVFLDVSDNGVGSIGAITSAGSFSEGVILKAGSVLGDPDGNGIITDYQWYLNDNFINGATGSEYTVPATGAGNYKVAISYLDGQQYSATLISANQVVGKVDNGNAVIAVSGSAIVGGTLTASIIKADPDGNGSFAYQWQALSGSTWSNIANATTDSYTITTYELYKQVRVIVTSTDAQGYGPIALYSNTTVPVVTPPDSTPPTITDISVQGNNVTLTFSEKVQATGVNNSTFVIKVGGTARSVSTTSYDPTNQNKVTLTLSGTAPASSTSLQVNYSGTSPNVVKDLAGNSLATFTNRSADTFLSGTSVTSLYTDYTNLTLTGSSAINGTGNAKNNTITGNQANNTINGAAGADVLTGLGGTDIFVYTTLANSLLGTPSNYTFDRITDFAIGQDKIDGPKTVSTSQLLELGAVATLDQAGLQGVLTTTKFVANGAATFTYNDNGSIRTFVAMNDGVAGFDVTKDAVVEITGATGLLTNLSIV